MQLRMVIIKSAYSILKKLQRKNPTNMREETTFHYAAQNGHHKICKLFIEDVDDKNPRDNFRCTPLHSAAQNGDFEF